MDIFIVYLNQDVIGVYDARPKAETVATYVRNQIGQGGADRVRIRQSVANYAYPQLNAGEELYLVVFQPVTDPTPSTRKLNLDSHLEQDDFQYDSRSRRFRVAVFAANQAAAEAEAETRRATFVTNNGL